MSNYGLVLVGSRPASATGFRPRSAAGKRGNHGYHTVADKSSIDESLFSSHNPGLLSEKVNFKPPWSYKKKTPSEEILKPNGRPLLWAPQPSVSVDGKNVNNSNKYITGRSNAKFRTWKPSPSYVDENLFGSRVTNVKDLEDYKKGSLRPYVWEPEKNNRFSVSVPKRPNSANCLRSSCKNNSKPIWKP